MNWSRSAVFCLIGLISLPVQAHGGEVFLFPLGQLLALAALVLACVLSNATRNAKWSAFVSALVGGALMWGLLWGLPGSSLPALFGYSAWGYLVLGLIPPLLLALAAWLVVKRICDGK